MTDKEKFLMTVKEKERAYYSKAFEEVISIGDKFYLIQKPSIQTSLCFGAGFNGKALEEELKEATEGAKKAREDEEFFIHENMEEAGISRKIKELENKEKYCFVLSNDMPSNCSRTEISFGRFPMKDENGLLYNYDGYYSNSVTWQRLATDEERESILAAYKRVKASFEKRLKTYLKRYGLSKVRSWSYIVD